MKPSTLEWGKLTKWDSSKKSAKPHKQYYIFHIYGGYPGEWLEIHGGELVIPGGELVIQKG